MPHLSTVWSFTAPCTCWPIKDTHPHVPSPVSEQVLVFFLIGNNFHFISNQAQATAETLEAFPQSLHWPLQWHSVLRAFSAELLFGIFLPRTAPCPQYTMFSKFSFWQFWAVFTAPSSKTFSLGLVNVASVVFPPFLNGSPGLDNGCFLLEMIPFRAPFGSPEAISVNSAKFPLPWQVLFREQPQVSNSGLVLELSDGKPRRGSHFLLKDQTLIFLFSTFFNFPDLSAILNQANLFLKCHHSPGEFWPKV